jgi:hypothetical protein
MNIDELHKKVIAVARQTPPSSHVPYAFEKRIMNRLALAKRLDTWQLWGGPLWRGAVSCIAITLLCGLWVWNTQRQADSPETLSQAFEAAVLAPPAPHADDAW